MFDLRLQPGRAELLPGRPAETWGVNGPYLGPTLRAARGDTVVMNVHNSLPETTTLHWHGMRLPARADGGPHQPIRPGATWAPSWKIGQPAASLWYHPHLAGSTGTNVYRGLAGMWMLDDPAAAARALPRTYGVDDIPLILQDKRLDGRRRTRSSRDTRSALPGAWGTGCWSTARMTRTSWFSTRSCGSGCSTPRPPARTTWGSPTSGDSR